MGATEYLRITVFTTSPNGLGFADVSEGISPTDEVVPLFMDASDTLNWPSSNEGQTVGPPLGLGGIRSNRPINGGKVYLEYVLTNDGLEQGYGGPGIITAGASLNSDGGDANSAWALNHNEFDYFVLNCNGASFAGSHMVQGDIGS